MEPTDDLAIRVRPGRTLDELVDRVLQMVALAGDKPRAALLMQLDDLESGRQP